MRRLHYAYGLPLRPAAESWNATVDALDERGEGGMNATAISPGAGGASGGAGTGWAEESSVIKALETAVSLPCPGAGGFLLVWG